MRDIIWTVIIIWLIYKLVDVFKSATAKRSYVNGQAGSSRARYQPQPDIPKKDMKKAMKEHLNRDGEYVDFEEIK